MKILVTGFKPFGGEEINPSEEVIRRLPDQIGDIEVCTGCLPVAYGEAEKELFSLIYAHEPNGVLSLGLAAGRCAPELERVAINLDDALLADNRGVVRRGAFISPEGPAAYFTTLPLGRIRSALQEKGIPSFLSLSAGAFLCNHVFYLLMEYAHKARPPLMAGFMHLPALPEQGME
ncbi:MAG TPA: pyroglutamyl-peptidase I, partial [Firmicutes bacterium]|nr:pyroglutamyl-peptidase I [Bacillota bacterium]